MTREEVIALCESFPEAVEDYPFGDGVAVFKVGGRMFALVSLDGDTGSINLKCDPDIAPDLRARHPAVRPGYHQDKRHWNTVELDGSIADDELEEMVDHSYELVVGQIATSATHPPVWPVLTADERRGELFELIPITSLVQTAW